MSARACNIAMGRTIPGTPEHAPHDIEADTGTTPEHAPHAPLLHHRQLSSLFTWKEPMQ